MSSGNQQRRSANRNCCTNSPPYGYGGRIAETIVLPVKIIMSPISSKTPRVGVISRSAPLRTTFLLPCPPVGAVPQEAPAFGTLREQSHLSQTGTVAFLYVHARR